MVEIVTIHLFIALSEQSNEDKKQLAILSVHWQRISEHSYGARRFFLCEREGLLESCVEVKNHTNNLAKLI